jgi:hypothetical protein
LRRTVATLIAAVALLIAVTGAVAPALLAVILLLLLTLLTLRSLLMLLTTTLAAIIRPWSRLQQRGHTNQHDTHGSDQRFWQFHQMYPQALTAKKGGRPKRPPFVLAALVPENRG